MARSLLVAAVTALTLLALACDGGAQGERRGERSPIVGGSPQPSPTLPPSGEPAVEAVRGHLRDTGLDGHKGELTDPIDCGVAEDTGAEGDFCIVVNAGVYAPGLAVLFVVRMESGDTWQVNLAPGQEGSAWEVTQVQNLTGE